MKRYTNTHEGAILSADISVKPESLQACLRLRDVQAVEPVRAKLATMGCTVVSQTSVGINPMLIVIGPRSEKEFIQQLSVIDGPLKDTPEKKPFDAWKVRSLLGFGGQGLQLVSAFMKHKVDGPLLGFAATNLTANGINLAYKAQDHDDPHQLRILKQAVNERLTPHLAEGMKPISVNDNRAILREQNRPHAASRVDEFMKKNSVNVGELGLRYFGAINMAMDKDRPLRRLTGYGSVLGKTVATTSLVEDPYNPKKPTWLESVRQKYSFLAGGLIETAAFSTMTYDAWVNSKPTGVEAIDKKRSLKWGGGYHRDYLSAIGSAMFVAGYIVRSWAKFGERHVNMPELYAHTSDMLSRLPPDQIPQALADTSAYLANHFKNKPGMSFSAIYNKLSDDLGHEHHIMINPRSHHMVVARDPSTGIEVTQVHPNNEIHTGGIEHTAPEVALAAQRA